MRIGDVINLPEISAPEPTAGHVTVYANAGKVLTLTPDGTTVSTGQMFPCHASLFIDEAAFSPGLGAGGLTFQLPTGMPYQLTAFQSGTPSVGDRLTWKPLLKAGTYRLRTLGKSQNNCGQSATKINGVSVATDEWYSAITKEPDMREHTGVSIPDDGIQTVTFEITGKNVSSSNFFFIFSAILMTRTGA